MRSRGWIALAVVIIIAGAVAAGSHVALRHIGDTRPVPAYASGALPEFSRRFTGVPSPFHETADELIARGARRQPPAVAANLWQQSVQTIVAGNYRLPIYTAAAGEELFRFSCVTYGSCGASGMTVGLPRGAAPSSDSDHHLIVVDPRARGELDGWGGDGQPAHRCAAAAGRISCSWGGFFPFAGNGLDRDTGDSANNGGFAFGLFVITAGEVLRGRIDHALGMFASCLDDPDIYPADSHKHTDTSCSGGTGRSNPQYGQLVRLRPDFDVAGSAYSRACKTILTALQRYGAYTYDTNDGYGIGLATDDVWLYADPNPWFTRIFPQMVETGDAEGSGTHIRFRSCLQRLRAADLDVYDVAPGT